LRSSRPHAVQQQLFADATKMAAAPEHLSFDVLRPIVIVSATISTLSGLLLSGLCARAWHLSAEQSPAANVQLVLMWLGVARPREHARGGHVRTHEGPGIFLAH